MNARSPEELLQQVTPPPADPVARLAARRAAVAEFERLHAANDARPARGWQLPRAWFGGLATACVAIVGVSIYWLLPADERVAAIAPPIKAEIINEVKPEEPPPPILLDMQALPPPPPVMVAPADAGAAASSAGQAQAQPREQARRQVATDDQALRESVAKAEPSRQIAPAPPAPAAPPPPPRPAVAGEAPAEEMSQVVVTGSRIVRRDVTSSTAITVVSAENLERRAAVVAPQTQDDRFEQFETNPVKLAAEEPESTFSVDVDTASYSFTRRMLNEGRLPPADAVRAEEMINYFDYGWPAADSRRQPFRPTVTVSDSPWGEGRKLVHIGIKGYEVPARNRPDVNLVLLLDVSGSMNAPDKLPLATRSVALLLDSLKPTDTVAIAVYAGAAGQVLPPTPVRERERIEAALDNLRAGGSTAGAQGIRLAYELAQRAFREGGVNRILLATDGDFNVGTSSTEELQRLVERERTRGIYLSVLGFGQGNYRDDVAQTLAQNGNGVAAYIDTIEEARKVLVQQAGAALFTIASDVKIQVEFNPATVAEYRLIGYETRALNREDFSNDKVDAGEVGSGHTVTAIYEITPVGSGTRMIDPRRYAAEPAPAPPAARGRSNEYGYLRIRYKLPGEDTSRLLEQPIRVNAGVPARLRQDVEFSTAVAGFAQLLRGGQYTGDYAWDDVIRAAGDATGEDAFGYRRGFVELARRARAIDAGDVREGRF